MINNNIMPLEGLADPHALVEGEFVYIFCGSDKTPRTEDTWRMDKWCILASNNLKDWKIIGEILPQDTYMGNDTENCWAGYILKKDNRYYWFFSNKNINIGVVVAERVEGPYVDILRKPLIPEGFVDVPCYDPCVYSEDGTYTMFFGAGKYYCVELTGDLLGIAREPQYVQVLDEYGKEVRVDDKCTVFKYKNKYYLYYGDTYAMSEKLKGPYFLAGRFVGGGHNDVFFWKNKWYVCNEFHETGIFYRGIRVQELHFDENGKVLISSNDTGDIQQSKQWDFSRNNQNWFLTNDQDLIEGADGVVFGLTSQIGMRSPVFPGVFLRGNTYMKICYRWKGVKSKVLLKIEWVDGKGEYWKKTPCEKVISFEVIESGEYQKMKVKLSEKEGILRKITLIGEDKTHGIINIKMVSVGQKRVKGECITW